MSIEAKLDHVVLLLPYKDITDPPKWLTEHFTLSPGGRHADGKTENRLVLFADGSYLELIAFINDDPEKRKGHWWDKPFGVVDWAFTTSDEKFGELVGVRDRLSQTTTAISYTDPKEGGRERPDGVELKWRVTFPLGTPRGSVPFWCHDVTPRNLRVPLSSSNTKHPSGSHGMAGVQVAVPESSVSRLATAIAAILDQDLSKDGRYEVGVIHAVAGAKKPSIRISQSAESSSLSLSLIVQTPQDLPAISHRIGDGTVSVVFEKV